MLARDLMRDGFPTVLPSDTLSSIALLFEEFYVCHFAIVRNGEFLGMFPAEIAAADPENTQPISQFREDWVSGFVLPDQHRLHLFEFGSKNELTAIPVATAGGEYAGTVVMSDLLANFGSLYSYRQIGGIIVLEVGVLDFDMVAIARIVSENNAKVMVMHMDSDEVAGKFSVTLKLSTLDLKHVVATFERFGYVVSYYYPNERQADEMQDRYDLLMKLFDL